VAGPEAEIQELEAQVQAEALRSLLDQSNYSEYPAAMECGQIGLPLDLHRYTQPPALEERLFSKDLALTQSRPVSLLLRTQGLAGVALELVALRLSTQGAEEVPVGTKSS